MTAYMLDSSVAIGLLSSDAAVAERVGKLNRPLLLSVVALVELEAGVARASDRVAQRGRLNALLSQCAVLPFERSSADAYGRIVETAGYSRRKVLDRMIAAHAIVERAVLVTLNPADFNDVPDLHLLGW